MNSGQINFLDVDARDTVQRKFTMIKGSRRMTQLNTGDMFKERMRKIAENST